MVLGFLVHLETPCTAQRVPWDMSCHKTIALIIVRAHCFHDFIYARFKHFACPKLFMTSVLFALFCSATPPDCSKNYFTIC